jgi:hypothetical protein
MNGSVGFRKCSTNDSKCMLGGRGEVRLVDGCSVRVWEESDG